MGLLGTVLGFIDIFSVMEKQGVLTHAAMLTGGIFVVR